MNNQQTEEAKKKWLAKKRKAQVQQQLINEQVYLQRIRGNDQSLYALAEGVLNAKGVSGLQELICVSNAMLAHVRAGGDGTWD